MDRKEAARMIYELKNEHDELQYQYAEALEKIAAYERRDRAEEVLVRANELDGAPSRLQCMSFEGFLSKRAELEEDNDYLEKAAALIAFSDGGDGFYLSDSPSTDKDPLDLNGWLASQM